MTQQPNKLFKGFHAAPNNPTNTKKFPTVWSRLLLFKNHLTNGKRSADDWKRHRHELQQLGEGIIDDETGKKGLFACRTAFKQSYSAIFGPTRFKTTKTHLQAGEFSAVPMQKQSLKCSRRQSEKQPRKKKHLMWSHKKKKLKSARRINECWQSVPPLRRSCVIPLT